METNKFYELREIDFDTTKETEASLIKIAECHCSAFAERAFYLPIDTLEKAIKYFTENGFEVYEYTIADDAVVLTNTFTKALKTYEVTFPNCDIPLPEIKAYSAKEAREQALEKASEYLRQHYIRIYLSGTTNVTEIENGIAVSEEDFTENCEAIGE